MTPLLHPIRETSAVKCVDEPSMLLPGPRTQTAASLSALIDDWDVVGLVCAGFGLETLGAAVALAPHPVARAALNMLMSTQASRVAGVIFIRRNYGLLGSRDRAPCTFRMTRTDPGYVRVSATSTSAVTHIALARCGRD